MKPIHTSRLAEVEGGSRNCGNWLETYVITQTCGLAGGFIGMAGGLGGAYVGLFAGRAACSWLCYYAC